VLSYPPIIADPTDKRQPVLDCILTVESSRFDSLVLYSATARNNTTLASLSHLGAYGVKCCYLNPKTNDII
jgi:hypothetical protein